MILETPEAVRSILQTDPFWCVYALGDLDPGPAKHCSWFGAPGDPPALILLYRGFSPAILFTLGEPPKVDALLDEIPQASDFSLHIKPEILPLIAARFARVEAFPVWRMALRPDTFRAASMENTDQLGPVDLEAVKSLYADGEETGESPDYFARASLEAGVFFGVWDEGRLVAAAGTHLVSERESAAAVGNVYTRRDCRGRGLAAKVTSAVVHELLRRGIATIALNVRVPNVTAIRVYERLGFEKYCEFLEGVASR